MTAALKWGESGGQAVPCHSLDLPRATLYRIRGKPLHPVCGLRRGGLSAAERQIVLDHLQSERFHDNAQAEVYAALLDESIYVCSIRTMNRILAENGELKERRDQLRHRQYMKPELLAGPIKSGVGT